MSLSLPGLQSQALPAGPTAETGVCSSGRHWPSSKGLDPSPPPPLHPTPALYPTPTRMSLSLGNWEDLLFWASYVPKEEKEASSPALLLPDQPVRWRPTSPHFPPPE